MTKQEVLNQQFSFKILGGCFDDFKELRPLMVESIEASMDIYLREGLMELNRFLKEEFLINTQNFPEQYHSLFKEKYDRAITNFNKFGKSEIKI